MQKAANKKRVYFVLRNGNSRDTDSGETVEGGQSQGLIKTKATKVIKVVWKSL